MIRLTRHRNAIRIALRRPPGLRHHRRLPARRLTDLLSPVLDEGAGAGGEGVGVEESVAVDGAEVAGGAEFDVVFHCDHGVDGDDGAGVACCF